MLFLFFSVYQHLWDLDSRSEENVWKTVTYHFYYVEYQMLLLSVC